MTTTTNAIDKVSITVEHAASNPNMDSGGRTMNHFRCTLKLGRKRMTLIFSQGLRIQEEPTAKDVIECLASDAAGIESAHSFEDWCSEYGYDTDSRTAERTYKACVRQSRKLQAFLGGDLYLATIYPEG